MSRVRATNAQLAEELAGWRAKDEQDARTLAALGARRLATLHDGVDFVVSASELELLEAHGFDLFWESLDDLKELPPQIVKYDGGCRKDIYFIQSGLHGPIKIGRASNVHSRLRCLQTASPFELHLLGYIPEAGQNEGMLHAHFRKFRLSGEWFMPAHSLKAFIESEAILV